MANGGLTSHGMFVYATQTKRFMFLLRQGRQRWAYHWGIVGGKQEQGESPLETLKREAFEETQINFDTVPVPIDHYISGDGNFSFYTYLHIVESEFVPVLNEEHCGYCWVPLEKFPRPMHPGVFSSIREEDTIDRLNTVLQSIT
jgi:8-oxo-dGTP pyrophosphatase MutT (NUDIX family)